jgi:hypothetical protein
MVAASSWKAARSSGTPARSRAGGHSTRSPRSNWNWTAVPKIRDGERLRILIELNRRKDTAIYRAFVVEFFERLGPAQRQRIIFREGVSAARRMVSIVFCVALLVLLLGVLVFGVVSGGFFQEEYAWLGIPLVLLFVGMLSGLLRRTLKSEQKTFDPQAIPQRCLPPAPR